MNHFLFCFSTRVVPFRRPPCAVLGVRAVLGLSFIRAYFRSCSGQLHVCARPELFSAVASYEPLSLAFFDERSFLWYAVMFCAMRRRSPLAQFQ